MNFISVKYVHFLSRDYILIKQEPSKADRQASLLSVSVSNAQDKVKKSRQDLGPPGVCLVDNRSKLEGSWYQ